MDILEKLHTEHELVKTLLQKMLESEDSGERADLFRQFKLNLVKHARAEEKIIYDALIELDGDKPEQQGDEGYLEHQLVDAMLEKLSRPKDKGTVEWTAGVKVVKELLEHHIREEEGEFFKTVKTNFSSEERAEMDEAFEESKKRVKVS